MKEAIGNSILTKLKPKEKAYDIWDTKLTGFILRVSPSGKMVYRCEYGRGKRITIGNTGALTPAQARDEAKKILSQAAIGILPTIKKSEDQLTLKKFILDDYESWRIANRKNGKDDLRRLKVNFVGNFGDKLLKDINPALIEKWRTNRINNGVKSGTVNRDIIILKSAISKAIEWGLLSKHPLQSLKLFKVDSSPNVRYLDAQEEQRLKEALDQRDQTLKKARMNANEWRKKRKYECLTDLSQWRYADYMLPMILISLNTGLRRGELLSLRWSHVNFDRAILTVTGDNAKSGKTRHLPLNKIALQVLKDWSQQTPQRDLIFVNERTGLFLGNVKRAWKNILRVSSIENFRWHDMRHHFASKLVMVGVDLNTVRELLGHSDIKMTLRYAHLAPEHKANAVAKLVGDGW